MLSRSPTKTAKNTEHSDMILHVEKASHPPAPVFSPNGAMGQEATHLNKILAKKIYENWK